MSGRFQYRQIQCFSGLCADLQCFQGIKLFHFSLTVPSPCTCPVIVYFAVLLLIVSNFKILFNLWSIPIETCYNCSSETGSILLPEAAYGPQKFQEALHD